MNLPKLLKFKLLSNTALVPRYASHGAACFDFLSDSSLQIMPGKRGIVSTGLACEVPVGHALMIYSRSGMAFNSGIRLSNCVGVIDSDYRGEIKISFANDGGTPYNISKGDRVAQGMLVESPKANMVLVCELSETSRGDKGFGSTGK